MAAAAPRRVIGDGVHRCLRGFVAGGRYNRLPSVKLSRRRSPPATSPPATSPLGQMRPDRSLPASGRRSHGLYRRVRKARAERLVMDVPSGPRGEGRGPPAAQDGRRVQRSWAEGLGRCSGADESPTPLSASCLMEASVGGIQKVARGDFAAAVFHAVISSETRRRC